MSVNTGDRVIVLAFCNFSYCPLSVYQVPFNSLLRFQRYAPDELLLQKNKKGNYSINTVDRVTVLSLCTFADSPLSTYQVLFNSLVYCQRYVPDNVLLQK